MNLIAEFLAFLSRLFANKPSSGGQANQYGGRAKNAKPSTSNKSVEVVTYTKEAPKYGGKAKNAKPWDKTDGRKINVDLGEKKPKLMGPKAKNRKHRK